MFLNMRYEGLSQLLAVPLTLPKHKADSYCSDPSISNSEVPTRNSCLGFTPFRVPEKIDLFELCNLKSTSEEASESFPSECFGSEGILEDNKLNSRLAKSKKGPYRKYTLEEKRLAVEYVLISINLAQLWSRS